MELYLYSLNMTSLRVQEYTELYTRMDLTDRQTMCRSGLDSSGSEQKPVLYVSEGN
jgi:hypothetical protein